MKRIIKKIIRKTPLYQTTRFIRNIWFFRKELWHFRSFDFSYNMKFLCRSLEDTRDFLKSDKAITEDAKKHAEEITNFLEYIDKYENSLHHAEKQTGVELRKLSPFIEERTPKQEANFQRLWARNEHIENDSWNKAMHLLQHRMQHWWD